MRSYFRPGLFALFMLLAGVAAAAGAAQPVYVGTYTGENKGKGIYLFRFDGDRLEPLGVAAETPSPSFLHVDATRRLLFAVNEVDRYDGQKSGSVSAFRIEPSGKLTLINQQPSMGTGPCHLALDASGRNLIAANYSSGSVTVLPVAADGRIGAPSCTIQHSGQSTTPRQKGPHAHCVTLDPGKRFVFVCDLGLDKVMIYRLDAERGQLTPADPAFAPLPPGSGPRHMVFGRDAKFAYVVNELNSTVTTFSYDAARGKLTPLQTLSTLPDQFDGKNTCAEIAVHPSGKWLYASNRGRDSIAAFAIDPKLGTLRALGDEVTGGSMPRHFTVAPDGRQLVVSNQNSNSITFLRIGDDGRLSKTGTPVSVPWPVCAVFDSGSR